MAEIRNSPSLRSSSSCSTLLDATTLVEVPTHTSASSDFPAEHTITTFGTASWLNTEYKPTQANLAFPHLSLTPTLSVSEPTSSSSHLVQLICKIFPKCTLAKKMNNVEKDVEKIIEKLDAKELEKREKKIQKLLARERVMEEEFSRLGW